MSRNERVSIKSGTIRHSRVILIDKHTQFVTIKIVSGLTANAPSKLYIDLVSDYLITLLHGNCGRSLVIMFDNSSGFQRAVVIYYAYVMRHPQCVSLSLFRNDRISNFSFPFFFFFVF